MTDTTINVCYMVDDVQAAIDFYTTHLGFSLQSNAAPAFAAVTRGPMRLLLSGATPARPAGPCRMGADRHPAAGIDCSSSSTICRQRRSA